MILFFQFTVTRVSDSEHRQHARSSVSSAGQTFESIDETSEYLQASTSTPTDTLTNNSSITALLSNKWRVSVFVLTKELI